jgi:hypothetical protein
MPDWGSIARDRPWVGNRLRWHGWSGYISLQAVERLQWVASVYPHGYGFKANVGGAAIGEFDTIEEAIDAAERAVVLGCL